MSLEEKDHLTLTASGTGLWLVSVVFPGMESWLGLWPQTEESPESIPKGTISPVHGTSWLTDTHTHTQSHVCAHTHSRVLYTHPHTRFWVLLREDGQVLVFAPFYLSCTVQNFCFYGPIFCLLSFNQRWIDLFSYRNIEFRMFWFLGQFQVLWVWLLLWWQKFGVGFV